MYLFFYLLCSDFLLYPSHKISVFYRNVLISFSFLFFQLPVFLSQVKEALDLPASSIPVDPVAGPSSTPPVPVSVPAASSAPPPIVLENSESDDDVQTLAVPFRSGSLETFLPMVSTDESWSTDQEFRFIFYFYLTVVYFHLKSSIVELG